MDVQADYRDVELGPSLQMHNNTSSTSGRYYSWYVLRYLSPLSPSAMYCTNGRKELPTQHRRMDNDARAPVAAARGYGRARDAPCPGSGMTLPLRVYQAATSSPPLSSAPATCRPPRPHVTLAAPGSAPSDPNRDESPYEYVDACGCVWVRLPLSFPLFSLLLRDLRNARLPAVFGAMSIFYSVRFLPPPLKYFAQTDSANIPSPKAKFLERQAVSALGLLSLGPSPLPASLPFPLAPRLSFPPSFPSTALLPR
ncbi:hypothetical protein B0H13DRAFT_2318299 [Mycena leptocephala]|nr:hypothetical protein B0H13DRAFT_2318299 [Mycena leptocephala]